MAFFKVIVAYIMAFGQIILPIISYSMSCGQSYSTQWFASDEYKLEDTAVLEKDPDKDFVILNLTDIQMQDLEAFGGYGQLAKKTIDTLVEQTNPDLITVTGDNAWATAAYLNMIELIDSYNIPWAPVMGNHDGQGTPGEYWCAYSFLQAKNCLFEFGPESMGYGNYIINITENGDIIHTVYMMDTHSNNTFTAEDGSSVSGYDTIWENQFEWYTWSVENVNAIAGHTVQSSIFVHIPLYEYSLAWDAAFDTANGVYYPEYAADSFGANEEAECCPPVNNGFFSLIKELDSTKDVICGHDHVNSSSIVYEGVRLTYGLKTGAACYWTPSMNGGTTLTISSDGTTQTAHHYIAQTDFGFNFD